MRILVTGGSGMLGHNFMRLASRQHEVWGSYHTHRVNIAGCSMFSLDLAGAEGIKSNLISIKPEVVVHTAALTDVDACEREPEKARRINAAATAVLADSAEHIGARFVYISTDYVFDGIKGDYCEEDSTGPVNFYGESKLAGEEATRQRCSRALILRTSIFGLKIPPNMSAIESLVGSLRRERKLARFSDQFATPIYTGHLSGLILNLLETGVSGLFHVGGGEKVSRFQYAQYVREVFSIEGAEVQPIPYRRINGLATRPRDSSLNSQKVRDQLAVRLPVVKEGLERLKSDWKEFREAEVNNDRRC